VLAQECERSDLDRASVAVDAFTLSISPERPCVPGSTRPCRPARRRSDARPTPPFGHRVEVTVGDDERHFDDAIGVRLEAGHLHVDPDEAACVLGHCDFA
jgi:hypothetical protein